jgi:hypothetical protein
LIRGVLVPEVNSFDTGIASKLADEFPLMWANYDTGELPFGNQFCGAARHLSPAPRRFFCR